MTLHLTALNRAFVLTVGDRLVTTGGLGNAVPFDAYANKSVVVLGTNCTVVASYAGLAFIDGKPTDWWLAERISGTKLEGGLTPHAPPMRFAPAAQYNLIQVVERIRSGLEQDLPRQAVSDSAKYLEVVVTGWTWTRKARWNVRYARPVFTRMRHRGRPGEGVIIQSMPRYWRWDLGSVQLLPPAGAAMGPRWQELARSLETIASGTDRDIEAALVAAIRAVASDPTGDVVGADCMAICLARSGLARVRFSRDPAKDALAYTPWVMGRGFLAAPAVMTSSGMAFAVADGEGNEVWAMEVETDPPLPNLSINTFGALGRPEWTP